MKKTWSADLTLLEHERLWHGLALLQRGQCFEAHECFEEVFHQRRGPIPSALGQLGTTVKPSALGQLGTTVNTTVKPSALGISVEPSAVGQRSSTNDVRTLFHGLSQLAAAYYQLSLGRARAARSTWNKACRNLALVDSLSIGFQQRVDALFVALGAGEGCGRFTDPSAAASVTEWPVPDTLRHEP